MIIEKFAEQVKKFAEEPAVITEHQLLTYSQLDRLANATAHALLGQERNSSEKDANQMVGLLFEHSTDMIVGVLGTLKAEKVYVPMDINYPVNRLAYMVENSGAGLVLTNTANLALARQLQEKVNRRLTVITLDTIETSETFSPLQRNPRRDRPAYILYTSGSTGKPKGVMQTHENVCYYIRNWTERFEITPADRMTLFSSFSHDGAGQDMFGALHNGAVLYPYNILKRSNISQISQWLKNERITIWHSVHTLYRYFIEILKEQDPVGNEFPDLRFILLGGEPIREHDIEMFKRFFPGARLANVYGQTESSVDSIWIINPRDRVNKMQIGDPLDQTELLIIDEDGTVIEDMGVGEILVACPHIAPGYWQDEQSSRQVFVNDPEIGLLYRTGDLGRLLADGNIEFLGRKDAQVKIRGFRVELGEVETALLKHPLIKETVVTARTSPDSNVHLCAYYVPEPASGTRTGSHLTLRDIREFLSSELPEYMIPSYLVELASMPLIPNGKIDRKKLPEPETRRSQPAVLAAAPKTGKEKEVAAIWKEILQLDQVGSDDNFFDLGGTSFDILKIMRRVYDRLGIEVPVVSIFRYPTIRTFAQYLGRDESNPAPVIGGQPGSKAGALSPVEPVAVIGMAGRFPGARDINEFWENIKNGVESIAFFSSQELTGRQVESRFLDNPDYVKAYGLLEGVEYFDAAFFNYTPAETEMMDPQLRIMHECSWEALENAGYAPIHYDGRIGIYAGNSPNHYWVGLTYLQQRVNLDTVFLNQNYSTKVSYKLNLKGPSVIVQTACSTALTAIHLACRGLLDRECDMALAGSVSIVLPDREGYLYQEGLLLSRDGHCRSFDANAGGTIFGNGAGMVVLKRLEDALADGDSIDAVIKGSALNNDGNRKVGLTAPSVEGEAEVIAAALQAAGLEPGDISYIETHGTGTILGDPVEMEALRLVYPATRQKHCALGSVKTNIGHVNSAAGAAGIIKTVMALKHKLIPPSLHFENPNPQIDFENSPFYVNTGLTEWQQGSSLRRAGVSSMGIGGTNVHVVLEEAPEKTGEETGEPVSSTPGQSQLILLSARTRTALEQMTQNLLHYFKENPEINLADAAYTLQTGRQAFKYRRMSVCSRPDELVHLETSRIFTARELDRPVIFMFPGLGAQYVNMGRELYENEPLFRQEMDRCFQIIKSLTGDDIKEILYPGGSAHMDITGQAATAGIVSTDIAQLAVFPVEYALAKLLIRCGIEPYAMIGYSFGEYAAACLSGVLSLEDALNLVTTRGKLLRQIPAGTMLSVPAPVEGIEPYLTGELAIAVDNGPSCIVAGPTPVIDEFEILMKEKRYICMRVNSSHAMHSQMMEPILDAFAESAGRIAGNNPRIPYISNVTGTWLTMEDVANANYWVTHLNSTVKFGSGLEELSQIANSIFIEVGPGRDLSALIKRYIAETPDRMAVDLIRLQGKGTADLSYILEKIGRLWCQGLAVDWSGLHREKRKHRVHLPAYPFERERFWLEGDPLKRSGTVAIKKIPAGKIPEISDWFYVPSWKPAEINNNSALESGPAATDLNWLIFADESGIGAQLREKLNQAGHPVMMVRPGDRWTTLGSDEYIIDPARQEDYDRLLEECCSGEKTPRRIAHLWNVTGALPDGEEIRDMQELGYFSLLNLARAIGRQEVTDEVEITVVSDGMQGIRGDDLQHPQKATVLGPLQVIPREFYNINCRSIDIEALPRETSIEKDVMEPLLTELLMTITDTEVALRVNRRWVKTFEARPLYRTGRDAIRLRQGGVYLITGGLGGIGLELGKYLAETVKARLVLTAVSPLPPRAQWAEWLQSHDRGDNEANTAAKIRHVQEIEELGGQVLVFRADAADRQQMQEVITVTREHWGQINGVIHAAGVPDGTIIQRQTRETSQRILNPKVTGTIILDELLKDLHPDFFFLFSSTVAVTALGGQVAYCAANVFLDHFARYRSARHSGYTVSINWDAWQQIGMAAKAVKKNIPGTQETRVNHPLFDSRETPDANREVWKSFLKPGRDWVLDEHRILGQATLPGTAYLEMASAAFTHHAGDGSLELRDVYFLFPMTIEDEENREVRTLIKKTGAEYAFSIISRIQPGEDQWVEHARGNAKVKSAEPARTYDIGQLTETCREKELVFPAVGKKRQQGAMTFGPRWDNLSAVRYDKSHGLAVLQLPEAFSEDVKLFSLHPALLDVATTFVRPRVQEEGAYMPFYYKRLIIRGALPGKVFCYSRYLAPDVSDISDLSGQPHPAPDTHDGRNETLKFDVILMDEQGVQLVVIEEFTLKRVNVEVSEARQILEDKRENAGVVPGDSVTARPYSYFLPGETGESRGSESRGMQPSQQETRLDPLRDAILPGEGLDAFLRILSGEGLHQVLVSTTDLEGRLQHLQRLTEEFHRQRFRDEEELPLQPKHSRPELSTPYAPPGTRIEQVLAEIWQDLLGIDSVGIDDDFFELGGDSLKAVGFAGKIHKRTHTEVPLAEFFDRPNIRQLARYIEGKSKKTFFSAVHPVEKREYYLLSPSQKRLYILHKMEGETIGYNLTSAVLLTGEPQVHCLDEAIKQLIDRHEAFRTSFEMVKDNPVQRVHEKVKFEIEYFLTPGNSSAGDQVKNFIRPFDLSQAPLLRVGLIKKEEKQYILIVDIHHIVYDGTSMAIFINEFMTLYGGKGEELPGLRLQYKDFAQWQVSPAALAGKKNREEYWLGVFSDEIPVIDLPLDFPRPGAQSYAGSRQHLVLEEKVTSALKTIAQENGVTLYMVLLSALNILLMKLSGQEDIVIGTVLAGRRHADLAHIVGMFVNTLALRSFPCHDKTFREFLAEVKEQTVDAFENQDYPFEELVEKVNVIRDASRNPLFDVMFRLHNFETPGGDIPDTWMQGLKLTRYTFNPHTSIFDLNFGGYEADHTLAFDIDYCTALFKQETVERFSGYFRKILEAVRENLDKRLSCFEILSGEEKRQLLFDFNDTSVEYPAEKMLQQIFGEQAAVIPDRIALDGTLPHSYYQSYLQSYHGLQKPDQILAGSDGAAGIDLNVPGISVSLTYRELGRRAERLAGYLRGKGVVNGTVVAILVQRTVQMMVGLLGILKAGGAYIPLDPGYPPERIQYIIKNSNAGILLTQGNLLRKCEEVVFSGEVVDIFAGQSYREGEHEGTGVGVSETEPGMMKMPEQPAYVIYTSGSTGNPKGVVISHRNAINFIKGMTERIVFSPGKTIVALTTICFDIFFLETFLPLCCGLRVVIATERHQQDPLLLVKLIVDHHVDILQVTPSRLKLIMSAVDGSGFPGPVKTLIVGGEAFPLLSLKQLKERFSGNIYNVYGPTETTIWSTVKEFPPGEVPQMTIGNPIANTRIYIMGRAMQLQPLGAAGDLLIGGDGTASGYLNNPGLTLERFLNHKLQNTNQGVLTAVPGKINAGPVTNKTFLRGPGAVFIKRAPGRRRQSIYITGDIARWISCGEIEFLGRSDLQVKVRGFRVELEEIEEQLLKHRNIKEAVVIARERQPGETYLCVYIVPDTLEASDMLTTSQLREFLSGHLPDYMIPSYFVLLEKIPLTPNGKIDRKSLPRDEGMHLETGSTYVAPQTGLEKQVIQLWQEVLQRQERISVEDNFFDLGGNSLNLIQLNSKINETLQVSIPVITMFHYPTVRSILEYLNREAPEVTAGTVDKEIDESMEVMDETMGVLGAMTEDEVE